MISSCAFCCLFFFFNDTATTEIYTLSLHDALPISADLPFAEPVEYVQVCDTYGRSEEHTSELQSRVDISYAVFCLKKKQQCSAHLADCQADDRQPGAVRRADT